MKKVLILEDNSVMLRHLSNIVRELDKGNDVFAFDNVKDAYQCVFERAIDLFIVDIILDTSNPADSSGLQFVENIRQVERYSFTPVIFVTSLEDVKSYTYENLHCYSFIEKPFDVSRVKQTIAQCLKFPGGGQGKKTLFFQKDGIILAVDRDDFVYAESINHVMYIHTKQKDVLEIPYVTVKKLMEEIDSPDIVQCSRNTIVNKRYCYYIDLSNRIIELKDKMGRLEIGVTFKNNVKDSIT